MSSAVRSAVVLGGSAAGSTTALLLAGEGWEVTLVDPALARLPVDGPVPDPSAPQKVHAHGFGSRTQVELSRRLPGVLRTLLDRGARVVPLSATAPPELYDGGRPGDEDIAALQVRRHVLDQAVMGAAAEHSRVSVVAERAGGLVVDTTGRVPVVHGLRLASGRTVAADVVVDAGGRRSPVTGWLRGLGIEQPERQDESIARYYSRHYEIVGERPGLNIGYADVHGFAFHVQLLFPGDGDTAVLALAAHDEDPVLKRVRHTGAFDALVAANEAFADWAAVLRPTSDVFCLGAFDNRARSLVAGDRPVVLNLHQVGDALALTNPTRGRGVSMALMSAGRLSDVLSSGATAEEAALAFEEWRKRILLVHYRECALTDSVASAQLRAALEGRSVPSNVPDLELPEGHPITAHDLERAAGLDPELFRVATRAAVMLDDERHVESQEVTDRVQAVLRAHPSSRERMPTDEPPRGTTSLLHDREQVADLLAPYE